MCFGGCSLKTTKQRSTTEVLNIELKTPSTKGSKGAEQVRGELKLDDPKTPPNKILSSYVGGEGVLRTA